MKNSRNFNFSINGRFLSAGPTAVHLVAEELTRALLGNPHYDDGILITAKDARKVSGVPEGKVRRVGRKGSILWEQLCLPRAANGHRILSFCNKTTLFFENTVAMIHDTQVFSHPSSYSLGARQWGRLHAKVACRRPVGAFTVSQHAKDALIQETSCDAERITVVHCGVDHALRAFPDENILDRHQLEPGKFVLALSNTQPHKNIALLLRAFTNPSLSGVRLVLTGGSKPSDFEALGITVPPNVIFPGYVNDPELRALQSKALVACTPSISEGFGLPPLEAMALGTPAIVAPKASLPEVCGDAALYADADNPSEWVSAIMCLMNDHELRERQIEHGLRHSQRFTWEKASSIVRSSLTPEAV
ncbi:glycosyltransferase family 4 protein [Pelagibacterium sp.]|uniref:glycosyltransferase family 4 protein n=1 Tax=Pelagibacterium sp. TaxID=1967288 RepID=UPI003A8F5FD0